MHENTCVIPIFIKCTDMLARYTVNLVLVRTLELFVHHKLFLTGQLKMSCICSYSGHFPICMGDGGEGRIASRVRFVPVFLLGNKWQLMVFMGRSGPPAPSVSAHIRVSNSLKSH